jgi:hypothetical protein
MLKWILSILLIDSLRAFLKSFWRAIPFLGICFLLTGVYCHLTDSELVLVNKQEQKTQFEVNFNKEVKNLPQTTKTFYQKNKENFKKLKKDLGLYTIAKAY